MQLKFLANVPFFQYGRSQSECLPTPPHTLCCKATAVMRLGGATLTKLVRLDNSSEPRWVLMVLVAPPAVPLLA